MQMGKQLAGVCLLMMAGCDVTGGDSGNPPGGGPVCTPNNTDGATSCAGPSDPNRICTAGTYCLSNGFGGIECQTGCLTSANCPPGLACDLAGSTNGVGLCRTCTPPDAGSADAGLPQTCQTLCQRARTLCGNDLPRAATCESDCAALDADLQAFLLSCANGASACANFQACVEGPVCGCDATTACDPECSCDPECGVGCQCDTGPTCQSGCDCDPNCVANPCIAISACGQCTTTPFCGWCGGSTECMPGTIQGPEAGFTCASGWAATQNFCATNPCTSISDCTQCALADQCGWCGASNSCLVGTEAGPTGAACGGDWTSSIAFCP